MVDFVRIEAKDYPLAKGESWWIVHPNSKGGEFLIPNSACTACLKDLLSFKKGIIYNVFPSTSDGWVCVSCTENMVELPQYLFRRHFDAEIFVRGIPTQEEIETVLSPFALLQKGEFPVSGMWED